MTNVIGANVEELRGLSTVFADASHRIDALRSQVERVITAAWAGPDAEQFRQAWAGSHRAKLAAVITGLDDARGSIDRNVAQQEQASGVSGAALQGSSPHLQGSSPQLQGSSPRLQGSVASGDDVSPSPTPEQASTESAPMGAVHATSGALGGARVIDPEARARYGSGSYGEGGINAATCVRWAIIRRADLGLPVEYTGTWDHSQKEPTLGAVIGWENRDAGGFAQGKGHAMVIEAIDRSDPEHIRLTVSEANYLGTNPRDVRLRELVIHRNADGSFSSEDHNWFIHR